MARNKRTGPAFKYFSWDEKDPIGKYTQPKMNDDPTGSGYPSEGVDNDNIMVKGRWPSGTKKKKFQEARGGRSARGRRFHEDD